MSFTNHRRGLGLSDKGFGFGYGRVGQRESTMYDLCDVLKKSTLLKCLRIDRVGILLPLSGKVDTGRTRVRDMRPGHE
jgi:hypothetical protein